MKKYILAVLIGLTLMVQAVIADERNVELLAASCAACHGTNGHSVGDIPSLAGIDKDKFIREISAFIAGERKATVMHQHALGYTQREIELLATFFSQQ